MTMLNRIIYILLVLTGFSCSENIDECASKMCVISGEWVLAEAFVDDEREGNDLSKYSLLLIMPDPNTATTSAFTRIQPSGNSDSGEWSVVNNGTILRLIPNNNAELTEDWIIESFSPRQLILVINRDISFKAGPAKIRFVLEPV